MDIFQFVTNLDSNMYHQGDLIAGDQIGDLENTLYFVLKGKVEVQRILEPDTPLRTYYLDSGDFFGFAKPPRDSRLREQYSAIDVNTKIGYLDHKKIIHIGKSNPLFFFSLLKHSIEKMLKVETEISNISQSIQRKSGGSE
ncbi:hypothetical protein [Leptospira sp. GIMC2001]|uniref:hypothetical protein n=1 Tax=Leptospira sp. GIMC2001 TaxID=1513297 RepID=UPI00234A7EF6|nr:hypothetical protein [Leptospira sp. GIMC2001]WCL50331.1 hypothetical protein O4O04_05790 [Leptospira sp. GIMC2001]